MSADRDDTFPPPLAAGGVMAIGSRQSTETARTTDGPAASSLYVKGDLNDTPPSAVDTGKQTMETVAGRSHTQAVPVDSNGQVKQSSQGTGNVLAGGQTSQPAAGVTIGATGTSATLELLTVSGLRDRFTFSITASISEVLAHVFMDWPEQWAKDKPASPAQLRLLHSGRFLPEASTLQENKLLPGQTTVVHLYIRPGEVIAEDPVTKAKAAGKAPETHGSKCCVVS